MNTDGGYTRQYRRLWDNPAFRTKQEAAVFSWMKDAAQWRPGCVTTAAGPVHLDVGELVIAERDVAVDFGLSRSTLRRLIERMIAAKMVETIPVHRRTIARTNGGTIVRIVNYQEYQGVISHPEGGEDHREDHPLKRNRTTVGPSYKDKRRNQGKEESEGVVAREAHAPDPTAPDPPDPDPPQNLIVFPAPPAAQTTKDRKNGSVPRKRPIAPDWWVDEQDRQYAYAKGHDDAWIDDQADRFRNRCLRDNATYVDWHAAWFTWVSNADDFAARDHRSSGYAGRSSPKPGEITSVIGAIKARGNMGRE